MKVLQGNTSKFLNGVKKICLSLAVLVLGLIIIEVIFGNWFGANHLNQLNIIKNVDIAYDVGDLYTSDNKLINYRRDRYGLRGAYGGNPSTIDILTLGGSTTDQRYITEGQTWQDILAKDFLDNQNVVGIANAGVDGQTTYGHIRDFDWWFPQIRELHPRYYLFYVGINDFYNEDQNEDLDETRLTNRLKQKSALYYLYRTIRGMYRVKRAGLSHRAIDFRSVKWVEQPRLQSHDALMRPALEAYVERLRILCEKVRMAKGSLIFVTQPLRRYKHENGRLLGTSETAYYRGNEINGIDYYLMMQLLNQKTLDICREAGGICIDLSNELEFDDNDFYDYYHHTPEGAKKIGHYLYHKLSPLFKST